MSDSELGVAVVGCGDRGRKHAAAWARRPDARVLAVADEDSACAHALATAFEAVGYTDWRAAIAHPGIDVVSVCVPTCLHAPVTVAAAGLGRHVLCEKPMALSLAEADRMIAACDAAGVQLVVSYQNRDAPRFQQLAISYRAGHFGTPVMLRFVDCREVRPKVLMHSLSGNGGPIHDMAGHFIDLMRWITGNEAEAVYASGHVFGRGKQRLNPIQDLGIDCAELQIRFGGGHVCSIFIDWGLPEGTAGHGEVIAIGPDAWARVEGDGLVLHGRDARQTHLPGDAPDPIDSVARIGDLVQAIRSGHPPVVDGRSGRETLRVTLAALESVRTGRLIDLRRGASATPG
ncbi:MAG: Gfo/Idh/MocA family protein [Planctomycetota bacterium]